MELYDSQGFSRTELASMLNASTTSLQFKFDCVFEILKPLFRHSDFVSTLVDWSLGLLKQDQHIYNIPPFWLLSMLREVDRNQQFCKHLNFLSEILALVDISDALDFTSDFCFSSDCLELLCSKLPCHFCLWLARKLVNSWKNSQEFGIHWTVDSLIKCVESINVNNDDICEFLHIIGELISHDSLEPFINSFVSKNFLHFWPSREKELNELNEVCYQIFATGLYFINETDVEQNYEKAFNLFQQAASLNHVESIFKVGSCYYLNLGVGKSFEKAAEYFKKAADGGHVFAMVNVGYSHYLGEGVFRSYRQAFNWFKKAADLNNSEGLYMLAVCHRDGLGIQQNLEESIRLLMLAVELGNARAMTSLAMAHETGKGVDKNIAEAVKFYQMAVDGGCSQGMVYLEEMYRLGKRSREQQSKSF
ncbi:hypothetical protein GEMRC1_001364 [Eukaryota sp. GEM-RC1]